jgi:hypothetical protein
LPSRRRRHGCREIQLCWRPASRSRHRLDQGFKLGA